LTNHLVEAPLEVILGPLSQVCKNGGYRQQLKIGHQVC